MARIMGIDFGLKRTGISATDPLQIIVSGLNTVETKDLRDFFNFYLVSEEVEKIVFGLPTHKDGAFTYLKKDIDEMVVFLKDNFPNIIVDFIDESFSSVQSKSIIFQSGAKKKVRQDKALVDKVSAVLILQKYLGHI
jgi:putative holliday junction resolvase